MERLRKSRRTIAAVVALFMLMGAGLGDMSALAGDPPSPFPLCTSDGVKSPVKLPVHDKRNVVCNLCFVGGGAVPVGYIVADLWRPSFGAPERLAVPRFGEIPARRAELHPLSRRGPPVHS